MAASSQLKRGDAGAGVGFVFVGSASTSRARSPSNRLRMSHSAAQLPPNGRESFWSFMRGRVAVKRAGEKFIQLKRVVSVVVEGPVQGQSLGGPLRGSLLQRPAQDLLCVGGRTTRPSKLWAGCRGLNSKFVITARAPSGKRQRYPGRVGRRRIAESATLRFAFPWLDRGTLRWGATPVVGADDHHDPGDERTADRESAGRPPTGAGGADRAGDRRRAPPLPSAHPPKAGRKPTNVVPVC